MAQSESSMSGKGITSAAAGYQGGRLVGLVVRHLPCASWIACPDPLGSDQEGDTTERIERVVSLSTL